MSEMKFTPGPWEYVPSCEAHGAYVTNAWGAGDICDCYVMTEPGILNNWQSKPVSMQGVEADANARLIAAAPELYEALKTFLTEYVDLVLSGDAGFWAPEQEEKVIAARAALAKAEGRE